MKYLFVSDLHIGHKKICEYTNRKKVVSQEDHDIWIEHIWNEQVDSNTTVFNLGDFVFNCKNQEKFDSVVSRLNGKHILFKANHDNRKVIAASGLVWHEAKGYNVEGQYVFMSHYPHIVWDKSHKGSWMLHGHCHGSLRGDWGKLVDVGLDSAYNILGEHRFFTMDDLRQIMSEREIMFHDHHTERTKQ